MLFQIWHIPAGLVQQILSLEQELVLLFTSQQQIELEFKALPKSKD